jgi:hypothetical protein
MSLNLVAAFELNNSIKVDVCDGIYGRFVKFVLEEPGKDKLWINLSRYVWQKLDKKMKEVAKATQQLQRNGNRHEFNLSKTDCNGHNIFCASFSRKLPDSCQCLKERGINIQGRKVGNRSYCM